MERYSRDQIAVGRRFLPPGPRTRIVPLRQHLRELPQLPHRYNTSRSARRSTNRRCRPRRGRRESGMASRSRPAPRTRGTTRHTHLSIGHRMTRDLLLRVEQVCIDFTTTGSPDHRITGHLHRSRRSYADRTSNALPQPGTTRGRRRLPNPPNQRPHPHRPRHRSRTAPHHRRNTRQHRDHTRRTTLTARNPTPMKHSFRHRRSNTHY